MLISNSKLTQIMDIGGMIKQLLEIFLSTAILRWSQEGKWMTTKLMKATWKRATFTNGTNNNSLMRSKMFSLQMVKTKVKILMLTSLDWESGAMFTIQKNVWTQNVLSNLSFTDVWWVQRQWWNFGVHLQLKIELWWHSHKQKCVGITCWNRLVRIHIQERDHRCFSWNQLSIEWHNLKTWVHSNTVYKTTN